MIDHILENLSATDFWFFSFLFTILVKNIIINLKASIITTSLDDFLSSISQISFTVIESDKTAKGPEAINKNLLN